MRRINMKIALGCDHAGFSLKEAVKRHLQENDVYVYDFGTFDENSIDYPDIAFTVSNSVLEGEFDRGIFICGTGVGGAMVANKIPGIRAALCENTYTARMSREHNNANVLCMGSRVTGSGLALEIVDTFLKTPFQGGRHQQRVAKIELYENRYCKTQQQEPEED